MTLVTEIKAWQALTKHAESLKQTHLRELLTDTERCEKFRCQAEGITLDFARQLATPETIRLLLNLAKETGLKEKVEAMRRGDKINATEDRPVLHYALRASKKEHPERRPIVDGQDAIADVHQALEAIDAFSREIRTGRQRGATGKKLTDFVVIGIGGSYLGTEFVHEALRTEPKCTKAAGRRRLRFLANVDPIDVERALEGLKADSTLVIIVSKTFTTAETILNAKTVRQWLRDELGQEDVSAHLAAVSARPDKAKEFGVPGERVFPMWDWVGGRYSVCSAVGVLPLTLQYGFPVVRKFLAGAASIDKHFFRAKLQNNLPVLMGLLGVWNSSFLGHGARAVLPYCQALLKFAPHIQQLDMESNGKRVNIDGEELGFDAGEVDFGEPGTNGQHSFYQLMHQGRVVPADFIGFKSQQPRKLDGEEVANHDELMSNFFAQPDALAVGKTLAEAEAECLAKGDPKELAPHKVFSGNRPSNSLLLEQLTPQAVGQLLALYEHRTAVQGFIWGLNSFDQWGVELGKVMAKTVRGQIAQCRGEADAKPTGFNPATSALLQEYLAD